LFAGLTSYLAGTNPIHNKKPKKKQVEEDDDAKSFKAKQQAGKSLFLPVCAGSNCTSRQEGARRYDKTCWKERPDEFGSARDQEIGKEIGKVENLFNDC
jgi:hypothetical protein